MKLVTLLEALLKRQDERRVVDKVISVTETCAVPPGENFKSRVTRLTVMTMSPCGKMTTKWLIMKELPTGPFTRAFVSDEGHFLRELCCYRDILTLYENLIEEQGYPGEIPWPRSIDIEPYSRIIIEDLQPLGYKMADKFEGLDLDHCTLALRAVGLFHALSILAKERGILPLDVFCGVFSFDNDVFANRLHATLNKLVPVLMSWGGEWNLLADKIQDLIPRVKEAYKRNLKTDESRLNVLNHGDCWTNNFMFKYDVYSGKPANVRILDFQMSNFNTPALDIVYFLAMSTNLEVRRQHVDHLINVYHHSLTLNMDILRVATPPPSLNTIREEVDRLGLFKLCMVLTLAPSTIVQTPGREPFDMEKMLKQWAESGSDQSLDEITNLLNFDNDFITAIVKVTLKETLKDDLLLK